MNPEMEVAADLIVPLDPNILCISDEEKDFLLKAVHPDCDVIRARIFEVQKEASEKYPYPCIRAFHFANLMMRKNAIYPSVVEAGRKGDTLLLDLGCCMGTDVRKLVLDGYPATNVLGCDLRPEFIQLSHKFFSDSPVTCKIRFFADNAFDLPLGTTESEPPTEVPTEVTSLSQLQGALTHVYTGALFHLFNEENQYALALRVASLLKRVPGAVVFGRHQGLENAGTIDDHLGRDRYGHSEASWTDMWKRVFTKLECDTFATERVVVQARLTEGFQRNIFQSHRTHRMLYWSVCIV
ncbi:uncharacterized protein BXZ73DRAFT_46180 [Epithele typhae]|uniref:uncharacterized protein n=1 Tax=Epithele typhae TaxID=378194 RepID=UPI0020075765|nr:uncharacterized protein BXZ73DRAFT_46180 [Epithele typhae]KAH9933633.1 hypothetical protein BXZ73DRAFT_46180 [Epithele typhae]